MSEEQKDAVIGRVLRERKETQTHLAALKAEATRLGRKMMQLGQLLSSNAANVVFRGQSVNIKDSSSQHTLFAVTDFDIQRIVTLTNEIKDTIEKLDHLNDQASKLGFEISNTELAHYPSSG
jgi:predicted  nucleic acid-binding Zn-ribbon protein